jgi:hypothetical protein
MLSRDRSSSFVQVYSGARVQTTRVLPFALGYSKRLKMLVSTTESRQRKRATLTLQSNNHGLRLRAARGTRPLVCEKKRSASD